MNQQQPPSPVKKGRELELDITAAAFEGKGLGKVGEYAVFVKNTAPGDRVKVRIIKKKKKYAEGVLLELLSPSPDRIRPECRHAEICGGCTWQHIPYETELAYKAGHVADHFQRIGGFRDLKPEPPVGAPRPYHYRNKMEYTFGDRRWLTDSEVQSGQEIPDRDFALGLHVPGRYDRILNIEECHLQHPVSYRILDAVRAWALQNDIPPYNTHKHTGLLRHLVIRNAEHTGDLMVNLVTRTNEEETVRALAGHLLESFPEITTFVHTVNDTRSPTSEGRYRNLIHGPGHIHEHLGSYRFRIDPGTFFQTNTLQAEALYEIVLRSLGDQKVPVVYDLYCGVGTLTLYASRMAGRIVGIELNEQAIEKARENAVDNGVEHAVFERGDMKDIFNDALVERHGRPDVVITDPPRAGMHEDVVRRLLKLAPRKIIYVSCNSATQARDVALLSERYQLDSVQPVDMFPRTYHIESVAVLSLRQDGL
ncbi:23S rRNA (uracil(1939)-C(5))-methyltransferase RlmD [Balneolales bacterium ANBcel1]|nr:23S rRNA (uracil(1939)-C(5))-methyltransferase RlmD [Balneolales bacterium ANBcel1]